MDHYIGLNPPKVKFKTVQEARAALVADKLGVAYVRKDGVFVITQRGTGKFSLEEWRKK